MKYSVIIPVYNNDSSQIYRAIQSVKNQTYKSSEIIIINDGSFNNDTLQALGEIANMKDVSIVHKSNEGAGSARNTGVYHSKSEIIAFLDCDDRWEKRKMEIQIKHLMNNPDIEAVACLYKPTPNRKKVNNSVKILNIRDQLRTNHIQTSTFVIAKKIFELINGFPKNQTHAEEGDLYFKVFQHSKIAMINQILVVYGEGDMNYNPSGLSGDLLKMYKGEYQNFSRLYNRKQISKTQLYIFRSYNLSKFIVRLIKRITR